MPIKIVKRYSREEIRSNPNWLYVFGDNFVRQGYGGQAAAARDEPNSIGIATKLTPYHDDSAFLRDTHFKMAKAEIDKKFNILTAHLNKGGTVVLPADGIGTGLADLPRKAPKIWQYLDAVWYVLKDYEKFRKCETSVNQT